LKETEIQFTFDGRRIKAGKGDTVAGALYRNGIKVLTRSVKFHRPRGLHCGSGECPNCLVNVDGVPNVRSCITPVSEGMTVRSQNRVVSLRLDPVSLMDHFFKRGFDYYHRFIRPAFARRLYQGIIRRMAGIGKVPSVDIPTGPTQRIGTDVLIIGEGATAMRAAERCGSAGIRGTAAVNSTQGPRKNLKLNSILDGSTAVGAFDDCTVLVSNGKSMNIIEPKFVILAEEGRDGPVIFQNWDLPGILRETAALGLIENRVAIGKKIVITGEPSRCESIAERIHGSGLQDGEITITKPGWKVLAAYGRNRIQKIVISDGGPKETLACDCLITCGPRTPRVEIARQLGCEVAIKGKAPPAITVDESFETSRKNVFAIGGSAGILDDSEAARSAEIAVSHIASRMKGAGS
jgi:NADPH-dependent 2,4-dienoyl-CoA reductase/sulfur reductase-like enzyme